MTRAEREARRLLAERSGGACEVRHPRHCQGRATNYSHRIAAGQGGPWSVENGVHACGSGTTGCHGWIERNPAAARARGLRLRRHQDPAAEPVLLARHGLVLLLPNGSTQHVPTTRQEATHGR